MDLTASVSNTHIHTVTSHKSQVLIHLHSKSLFSEYMFFVFVCYNRIFQCEKFRQMLVVPAKWLTMVHEVKHSLLGLC